MDTAKEYQTTELLLNKHLLINHLSRWLLGCIAFAIMVSIVGSTANEANASEVMPETETADSITINLPIMFNGIRPNIAQNKFGVQMYFETGNNQDNPYYDSIVKSGASWVRCNIRWTDIEPVDTDPSRYNWESAQRAVGANRDGRYNQIITLEHAPAWFSGPDDGPPLPGQSLDDLAEFMGALAERYDGDGYLDGWKSPVINHFELYNEPDHQLRWGNDGAAYAEMLSVVYPAIKAANPNAQVLFGGVAMDWFTDVQEGDAFVNPGDFVRTFVDDVFAAGGGQYIDVMAIHQYPAFSAQWSSTGIGKGLVEKVDATRQIMREYGLDKPIMVTESGTNSNRANGEEIQSRYVTELFTQAYAADVEAMIWFTMYDGDTINNSGQENGLVQQPVTAGAEPYQKKSLTAFATVVSMLEPAQFQRELPVTETGIANMKVYQFINSATGKTFYVAWMNPIESTAAVALSLPGVQATLTDIYGNVESTVADATDGTVDGRVIISVGGQPRYIEID